MEPVYLDVCSILIIDIMNFDTLTSQCSAEETAQFLTDVHGTYFEEASKFDCWMMETLTQKITVRILYSRKLMVFRLSMTYFMIQ